MKRENFNKNSLQVDNPAAFFFHITDPHAAVRG